MKKIILMLLTICSLLYADQQAILIVDGSKTYSESRARDQALHQLNFYLARGWTVASSTGVDKGNILIILESPKKQTLDLKLEK